MAGIIEKLKLFHEISETERVLGMLKFAQTLDICFVFDATGSMKPYLGALHENIKGALRDIQQLNPNLQQRLGYAMYRDPEDGREHLETLDLQGSITKFVTGVQKVHETCGGGGDTCEDVIIGLEAAAKFDWQFQNRLLFLCGDAPCHGRQYHDGCDDWHPDGLGISSQPILHKLIEKDVQVIFWKINDTTNKMIAKFNEEAATSERQILPGDRPLNEYILSTDLDFSSKDPAVLGRSMAKTFKHFMSSSMATSSSKAHGTSTSIKHVMKRASDVMKRASAGRGDALSAISEEGTSGRGTSASASAGPETGSRNSTDPIRLPDGRRV